MTRYVLTNYTIQCRDAVSGKVGCFLFDIEHYRKTGEFKAESPVFPNLIALYEGTTQSERKPLYIECDPQ